MPLLETVMVPLYQFIQLFDHGFLDDQNRTRRIENDRLEGRRDDVLLLAGRGLLRADEDRVDLPLVRGATLAPNLRNNERGRIFSDR